MFDEVLTIESLLESQCKAISTKKNGSIVFNIEDVEGNLIAHGKGGTVISALNHALTDYARSEEVEHVGFIHPKREKDLAMNSLLENSTIIIEYHNKKINISYLKNANLESSYGIRRHHSKGVFLEDYTVLKAKDFKSAYTLLSDTQNSKEDIVFDLERKLV
ncbi:MAG: hypothetical protein PHT94_01240 [Candidatus Nanoarchaeia archaeon]|nr:hypothetical protein [Candidatus Nanoarchaeia archaeon]